jgi:hypothetical protein
MVNLLSLAATADDLAKTCLDIVRYISGISRVDDAIEAFQKEINELAKVLSKIHIDILSVGTYAITSRTDREHWVKVGRVMEDFDETLRSVDDLTVDLNKTKGGFLRKGLRHIKLDWKAGDIALLQRQVSSGRMALGLSLQMIS